MSAIRRVKLVPTGGKDLRQLIVLRVALVSYALEQSTPDLQRVYEQVSQSGLFSQVSYDPVPSGRKLSISINNIALTDNVAAKGFGVGLTFGLVGTMVTDGYICTVNYVEPKHDAVTKVLTSSSP